MAVPQTYVDALIAGTEFYRWNANAPLGTQTFVTYSFMNAVPDYDPAGYRPGFTALTEAQRSNTRGAFAPWKSVSGLTFLEVPAYVGGNIAIGMFNNSGTTSGGFAYYPVVDDDYNSPLGA